MDLKTEYREALQYWMDLQELYVEANLSPAAEEALCEAIDEAAAAQRALYVRLAAVTAA